MPDVLDSLRPEEIEEAIRTEQTAAKNAAEAMKQNPYCYDALGNYVFWLDCLTRNGHGEIEKSYSNLCMLLRCDLELDGIVYNKLSESLEVKKPLPWRANPGPWRDTDDAQLIRYVDERFAHFPIAFYGPALTALSDERGYHPIVEYLRKQGNWDGVERLDTLLVDYLGAEDLPYVRAVTRKALCAAIRRIAEPGCKFDHILVLSGPQGIGKSTLLSRLGGPWFTDCISVSDMNDKTAAELLQGYWLVEISEMAGMKKAELEKVKAFLTRQDDKYRPSYGKRVVSHPRQCIFFGTTNEDGYLRDVTGNRRFWTVPVDGSGPRKPWDLDDYTVGQIWLEAVAGFPEEKLFLEAELETEALRFQREAMEQDDREGLVRDYLEVPIPETWDGFSYGERMAWYQTPGLSRQTIGTGRLVPRQTTSNIEIWCECFGRPKQELSRKDSASITAIMAKIEGWERDTAAKRRGVYGPQKCYQRTGSSEQRGR